MDDPSHDILSNGNGGNSNSQSHGQSQSHGGQHGTHLAVDDDGIAYAAQAAADAVVEADALDAAHREAAEDHEQEGADDEDEGEQQEQQEQQQQQLVCRICERGDQDGRPMLRFLPVEHDVAAANAAPGVVTFSEDIALHIFCGKTASILQSVNQPDLEILTKAGLKNKHGIGAEVNAALARTRCAILSQAGSKEKHYYLVREFEAHLAAIRHTHINFEQDASADPFAAHAQEITHAPVDQGHHHPGAHNHQQQQHQHQQQHQQHQHHNMYEGFEHLEQHGSHQTHDPMPKTAPIKASAGQMHKPGRRQPPITHAQEAELPYGADVTEDGKIRCGCGGTHLPTGTQRGVHSWRNHVMTKRHQKWMEDNGLLGAV